MEPIAEWSAPGDEVIRRDVIGSGRPAVLRGVVRAWPMVEAALRSPDAAIDYLRRFDNGSPVDAILMPPEAQGRVFYDEAMSGFNFARKRLPLGKVLEQLQRYAQFPRAPALAIQSAPVTGCLPGFEADNPLTVLDGKVSPRIWLGSAVTTPTHLDEWHNIGCVVAGRRRFTLFPPGQIGNLYIGPIDFAPTGAPMSLVRMHAPDFERFPRFRDALAAAVTAELEPGDALYIPPLWWHNVESLEPFNVLINYWWHALDGVAMGTSSAFDALIHAVLDVRRLPEPTRAAWHALFEHYVFADAADVTGHIPAQRRGVLGTYSSADLERVRGYLAQRLRKD